MKYKKLIIAGIAISVFLPTVVLAQNSSLWALISAKLKPVVATWGLQIPSLGSVGNPCVTVGTTGIFATSSCPGGMGTSTNPFMASYFVATSTATTTFAGGVDITGGLRVRNYITGDMTLHATGNATIGGTLGVTGASTLTGAVISSNIAALTTSAESWIGPSNTTGIYFKGGLVGIGTTAPGTSLHILTANGQIKLERTLTNEASFIFSNATVGSGGQIRGLDAGGLRFTNQDASTEWARITTAGNVGIGTTTPGYKLDVYGDLRVGIVGSTANSLYVNSTTGSVGIGTEAPTSVLSVLNNQASGNSMFKIGTDNQANILNILSAGTSAAIYVAQNTAVMNIGAGASGDLSYSIRAQGGALFGLSTGNVGIGTTSPATKLDVNGTITQLTVKSCSLGLTTDALGSITGCVASDEKLKTNVTQITGGDAILGLNPVLYQWKDKTKDNGMVHSGFVAQQVEKVMPEAVVNAGTNIKGVDSNSILSYTVKFIQDLYASFQKLVARVSGLEQKLNAQQKQIDAIQLQINNLIK